MTQPKNSLAVSLVTSLLSAFLALVGWSFIMGGKLGALEAQVQQNKQNNIELKMLLNLHMEEQKKVADLIARIDERLKTLQR